MSEAVAVSVADLLRALQLAGGDAAIEQRYASLLGFEPVVPEQQTVRDTTLDLPRIADVRREVPGPALTTDPARAPLRAQLFAITSCTAFELDAAPTTRPASAVAPLRDADCQPLAHGRAPFMPLVRPQLLWPALRSSLSTHRYAGVHVPRLVQQLARRDSLRQWPRRWRRAWRGQLQVVWDVGDRMAPYWMDYQSQLMQLLRLHGPAGVAVTMVNGAPGRPLAQWRMDQPQRLAREMARPSRGTCLLLFSDLGVLADHAGSRNEWLHYLRQLRRDGVDLVAWVPHSARQVEAETASFVCIYCLDPASRLRRQRGRVHNREQRIAEHARLCALREELLVLGACCVRIEHALLRSLRALLPQAAAEPGLEGLCWSYVPTVVQSEVSRPLAVGRQADYRERFGRLDPSLQQQVLAALLKVHAYQGRSTQMQEVCIWESHASASAKAGQAETAIRHAQDWWMAFVARAGEGGAGEWSDFARDVLRRNGSDEAFQRRHSHWLSTLFKLSGGKVVPPGLDSQDIARAFENSQVMPRRWQLYQIGEWLQLCEADGATPRRASRIGTARAFTAVEVKLHSSGQRRGFEPQGQCVLLDLHESQEGCRLILGNEVREIRSLERPVWAGDFGRDRYGVYADLRVEGRYGSASQRLRYIEPGVFLMGSPTTELARHPDEDPQHTVLISEGFWLADTACTQALWQAVVGRNPSDFKGSDQLPVEQVSWHDVVEFLDQMEQLLPGSRWSLPTEAQWEYACRAGTIAPFSCGENITPEAVNYDGNYPYADGVKGECRGETIPVKGLPPNPWGLYEMHGNVWEWCVDGMRDYTAEPAVDPIGPLQDSSAPRAVRGGSWSGLARRTRSAFRGRDGPENRDRNLGFRFCSKSESVPALRGAQSGSSRILRSEVRPARVAGRRVQNRLRPKK